MLVVVRPDVNGRTIVNFGDVTRNDCCGDLRFHELGQVQYAPMKKKSQFRSGRGATRFGYPQALQSFSLRRSLELASALRRAKALHQAGRLAEAEKICEQILKVQPNHVDSLHLLGVIYYQQGNYTA